MADIVTPVGRIVWGNPLNGRDKTDQQNNPVINPQTGQPVKQWSFGLAISKQEAGAIFQAMQQEAATVFPNGAPQNFAWKFKDGDALDDKGIPFSNREGYAGCVVLAISTEAFPPRVVRLVGGAYQNMTDGIKTGDYVRVALNIKAHAGKVGTRGSVPGLYLNPTAIEFVGYGQEIISGPDASTLFGGVPVALPPGASATPLAPAGPMPGAMPAAGAPMMPGSMPGNVAPAGPAGTPAQPAMNSGLANAAGMFPSNPAPAAPHPQFVNQVMPGMVPGMPQ